MPVYSERGVSSEHATSSTGSGGVDMDIETLLGNEALQKLLRAGIGANLQDHVLEGGVLEVGDRGEEVAELQEALGFLSPDGILGPMTEGSLYRLQQAMGIPVTGVLDAVTLLAIADIRTGSGPTALLFQHQSGGASRRWWVGRPAPIKVRCGARMCTRAVLELLSHRATAHPAVPAAFVILGRCTRR